ncbi:hypothetical protein Q6350_11025 [Isoptericola sp. b515]|uniref:hypothetical protein n=1 Tax=Isoptericola sp. b515 TaxID=3064652 RepID=UPI0027135CEE|nr:hypothetical protein [Isoptericola sp. b515]MDO8148963.1 hypothetical protein [Isoptericola sp. b515]
MIGMAVSGRGYTESPVLFAVMACVFVNGLVATAASIGQSIKARAEKKSGYTTLLGNEDLVEVDDSTRCVLRAAGEARLSGKERERRIELNRQALR